MLTRYNVLKHSKIEKQYFFENVQKCGAKQQKSGANWYF